MSKVGVFADIPLDLSLFLQGGGSYEKVGVGAVREPPTFEHISQIYPSDSFAQSGCQKSG